MYNVPCMHLLYTLRIPSGIPGADTASEVPHPAEGGGDAGATGGSGDLSAELAALVTAASLDQEQCPDVVGDPFLQGVCDCVCLVGGGSFC